MAEAIDIDTLRDAILNYKVVTFDYVALTKNDEFSTRQGECYEIRDGYYLWLFDYTRGEIRKFILSRVSNVVQTGEVFVPRWDVSNPIT